MTKPFESYRDEIVRLYIDENRTLEVVMDVMRERHRFSASRRSYMDNLKKWGVRKYKRKVVVHNGHFAEDGDDEVGEPAYSCAIPISRGTAASAHRPSPSQSSQSIVLPYHYPYGNSTQAQLEGALAFAGQHQSDSHTDQQQLLEQTSPMTPQGWGYFADSKWPPEVTATQGNLPQSSSPSHLGKRGSQRGSIPKMQPASARKQSEQNSSGRWSQR